MAVTTAEGSPEGGYVVLLDFPMTLRPEHLLNDRFPVNYEPGLFSSHQNVD